MKSYQSVLPVATRKDCQSIQTIDRHLGRKLKARIAQVFANGFWYCHTCEARCERIEGENGQPAHCDRCRSPRIDWTPPAWLIQPEDLRV